MNKYSKYVNALFIGGAVCVWFVTRAVTEQLVGYFQLVRRIGPQADALHHVVPGLLALLTFILLRRSATAVNFTTDGVSELVKVHWPSTKEVQVGTVVVILTVILAGIVLGFLDLGLTALIRTLIGA